jgi:hypothetical protein
VSLLIFVATKTYSNPWQRFDLHQHICCSGNLCLPKCCLAVDYSGFQASCHNIVLGIKLTHILSGCFQSFQCIQECCFIFCNFLFWFFFWPSQSKTWLTLRTRQTLRVLSHVGWSSDCIRRGCILCQSSSSSSVSFTALSSLLLT